VCQKSRRSRKLRFSNRHCKILTEMITDAKNFRFNRALKFLLNRGFSAGNGPKIFGQKQIFWQFSDSPIFYGEQIAPLPPCHDAPDDSFHLRHFLSHQYLESFSSLACPDSVVVTPDCNAAHRWVGDKQTQSVIRSTTTVGTVQLPVGQTIAFPQLQLRFFTCIETLQT